MNSFENNFDILARFPTTDHPFILKGSESESIMQYESLIKKLNLQKSIDNCKTIAIISERPEQGKSTVLFNLAKRCAENGMKVLIINTDIDGTSIENFIKIESSPGLGEWLASRIPLNKLIQNTSISNLYMLTGGNKDFKYLFNRHDFHSLLEMCRLDYDLIAIDSPSMDFSENAKIISLEVDMALVIADYKDYIRNNIRCKKLINEIKDKFFGIILNKVYNSIQSIWEICGKSN
jgi:Mrp family chromosome partitioning ATPase